MEGKALYTVIVKRAFLYLLICSVLAFAMMQEITHLYGVLFGGFLSIGGFLWIVAMTNSISTNPKARSIATGQYLIRYLIYAVCFYLAMRIGLNIISIVIGYLCINVAIKITMYLEGKEED